MSPNRLWSVLTAAACTTVVACNGGVNLQNGEPIKYSQATCYRPWDYAVTHNPSVEIKVSEILKLKLDDNQKVERLTKLSQDVQDIDSQVFRLCEAYGNAILTRQEYHEEREIILRWKAAAPEYVRQLEIMSNALTQFSKGQLQPAMEKVDVVLTKNPRNDSAHNLKGKIFHERKDYKNAYKEFETAHLIDDTVVDYMFNMAGALQSIGGPENRDKAQLLYEGVMRAKPDHVYATWNLAEIYLSKNDREGATRLYDNIIRIDFGLVDQAWIRKSWIFAANSHSNEDRKNVLEALRQAFQKTSNDILICKQLRREEPTYRWLNHDSEFIAITETCRGWPN